MYWIWYCMELDMYGKLLNMEMVLCVNGMIWLWLNMELVLSVNGMLWIWLNMVNGYSW